MNNSFQFEWSAMTDALPTLMQGVKFTLLISLLGILLGVFSWDCCGTCTSFIK